MRHSNILWQLKEWANTGGRGAATDASAGFVLPNGARRSPDAAWTLKSRILQLDLREREGFWHLCPDFVIEVRSKTDRLRTLRDKMGEWIANGAQLAWMLDPEKRQVEVFRPGAETDRFDAPEVLRGEGLVEGFVLQLGPLWDPLGQ